MCDVMLSVFTEERGRSARVELGRGRRCVFINPKYCSSRSIRHVSLRPAIFDDNIIRRRTDKVRYFMLQNLSVVYA